MPDLLDSAPKDTTPAPGGNPDPKGASGAVPNGTQPSTAGSSSTDLSGLDTGGPSTSSASGDGSPTKNADGSSSNGSPDKKPVDLESAIAEALSARKDADARAAEKKASDDRVTALEAELAKYKPAATELEAGKRAAAIKAFGVKIDDDLLIELAKELPSGEGDGEGGDKQPSVQELAEAAARKIIDAEKEAAKKAEDEKKSKDDAAQAEADKRELDTYKKRAAVELKAALADGKYPFIADYGCDEAIFLGELKEIVEKTGKLPEPAEILSAIEAKHEARWKKSRFAPKEQKEPTFEEMVAASFKEHKDDLPYQPPPEIDDERAALARMDAERRNRRDWRA